MQKRLLFFALFMSLKLLLWANNNIEFTASAPSNVAVGERFRVDFRINARPSDFKAPEFSGFRVLSGPSQSTSTSVQITNGQMTQTMYVTFTFILEALDEGNFIIPPASATIENNTYTTRQVQINVGKRTTPPPHQAPSVADNQKQQLQVSDQDVFIRANVSNANPFQGQQVIITYNLYTRVVVQQYSNEKLPSFQGFWAENITKPGQPQVRTETINGQSYHVAEILRFALFPQQSGRLTIEPLEVQALIRLLSQQRRGRNIFDDFFGNHPFGSGGQMEHSIKSNPVTVDVKPLPVQNKPQAFNGIVGSDFEIQTELNSTGMLVNDAANLSITISGKGNIRMVDKPTVNFPANLEVFEPNISDNISASVDGISGTRRFEYVLIPRTPGEFVIPQFEFVYFDPVQRRYITRTSPGYTIQVGGTASVGDNNYGIAGRENIRILDTDIRFINTAPLNIVRTGQVFYRSFLFYSLVFAPLLLFTLFVIVWRKQIKLKSNTRLMKTIKAEKLARKRLKQALKFMDQGMETEFYDEVFRALWGYLSDKLAIPLSILNKETVSGAFKAKKVPDELSQSFLNAVDECEFARFAPGQKKTRMDDIFQQALNTIILIEKELKGKINANQN